MAEGMEGDVKGRAWARLLVTNALALERIEALLAERGLPPLAWYDVLWVLENEEEGRMRMHELAERVLLSRSNLTRLVDRMEDAGLIAREPSPGDRRGALSVLTAAGRAMRKRMWPVYKAAIDAIFAANVTAEEARVMAAALEKVRRYLRAE